MPGLQSQSPGPSVKREVIEAAVEGGRDGGKDKRKEMFQNRCSCNITIWTYLTMERPTPLSLSQQSS